MGDGGFHGASSDIYALLFESLSASWDKHVDFIKKHSNDGDALSILDVGAGPGEPSCRLAACLPNAKVTCSDVSDDNIAKAKTRGANMGVKMDFATCGGQDLSQFGDGSFDFVTMNMVLMFVPDRTQCLKECFRVLKPGGMVMSVAWKANGFMATVGKTMVEYLAKFDEKPDAPPPVNPMALAAENAQEDLAKEANFEIVETELYEITQTISDEATTRAAVNIVLGPKIKAWEDSGRKSAGDDFKDMFIKNLPEEFKDGKGGYAMLGKQQMIVLKKPSSVCSVCCVS